MLGEGGEVEGAVVEGWGGGLVGGQGFKGGVSLFTFFNDCLAIDFLAFIFRCEDFDINAFL